MSARIALGLALLCLLAAGCGDGEAGPETTAGDTAPAAATTPAETGGETETGTATDEEPAAPRLYEVWLADRGFLRLGWRPGPTTEAAARQALRLLLGERALTAVPQGTRIRGVDLDGDAATVDLSRAFGVRGERLRVGQIVYTVTQFDTVRSVEILVEGKPLADLPGPHTREDFEDDLAPIIVESPTGLEPVSSPFTVSGTANVFEANVVITLLGDLGQELASTNATATCGSGCRGDFETRVEFSIPAQQAASLVLSSEDASGGAEGSGPYTVEIPLVLNP